MGTSRFTSSAAAMLFAAALAHGQCQWLPGGGVPGLSGWAAASIVYDDGTGPALYVAGSFQVAGEALVNSVARWDGAAWHPLGTGIDGGVVQDLTVYNGELVACGSFTTAGGIAAKKIAAWNGTQWRSLGGGMTDPLDYVFGLTVYNGELVAAGRLRAAGGVPVLNVAAWNGSQWRPLGDGLEDSGSALEVYDNRLIAAGIFQGGVWQWDGTSWSFVGGGIAGGQGIATGLERFRAELIVTGSFTSAGGTPANSMAAWNGSQWRALSTGSTNTPYCPTTAHDRLYVAQSAGLGGGTNLVRWDGQTWEIIPAAISGGVNTMIERGPDLFIGGTFLAAGGTPAMRAVLWNGQSTWTPMGGGFDDEIRALAPTQDHLVAIGRFTRAGSASALYAARWDGTTWFPMGQGVAVPVNAAAMHAVPFGGGVAVSTQTFSISFWNGSAWSTLGGSFDDRVGSLQRVGTSLFAGGAFDFCDGVPLPSIAVWDGGNWLPVGDRVGVYFTDVTAIGESQGSLLAAGSLHAPSSVRGVAQWDGSEWHFLPGSFNQPVRVIADYQGRPVVAGSFTSVDATSVQHIARWNGSAWVPLGSGLNGVVHALQVRGTDLYAAGEFSAALSVQTPRIARWDGAQWHALDGGADGNIYALAEFRGDLAAGGAFSTVDGLASKSFARWSCPPACYPNCDSSTVVPLLTANDFACFLTRFAAGETYANCDGSTGSPPLTANDFACFLTEFAAGCS
jgi:trimeric autotransporter adhesin